MKAPAHREVCSRDMMMPEGSLLRNKWTKRPAQVREQSYCDEFGLQPIFCKRTEAIRLCKRRTIWGGPKGTTGCALPSGDHRAAGGDCPLVGLRDWRRRVALVLLGDCARRHIIACEQMPQHWQAFQVLAEVQSLWPVSALRTSDSI